MKNKEEYQDYDTFCLAEISQTNEINRMQLERDAIRMQILKHPDTHTRAEGSFKNDNGRFKVTTTARMNRKIIKRDYEEIKDNIPEQLSPFVLTLTLDKKKLRALEEANPELHLYCCRAIEETPGKVGVSVEESN